MKELVLCKGKNKVFPRSNFMLTPLNVLSPNVDPDESSDDKQQQDFDQKIEP